MAGNAATFLVRLGAAVTSFLSQAKDYEVMAAETVTVAGGKAVRPHVRLSRAGQRGRRRADHSRRHRVRF